MENLPRPVPPLRPWRRAADWAAWIGPARLALSAAAIVLVAAGAFWLTRTPPPPTEASLPRATSVPPVIVEAPSTGLPGGVGAQDPAEPVTVHVTGAVERPGVYELPAGARVADAVARAGGATGDGEPDAINLAAAAVDGARIYVPRVGEAVPADPSVGDASAPPSGPVDVNRATAAELDELPGIGPATATAIVTERERNGPFATVDDLVRVPGIGPVKLDALRGLVTT